MLIKILFKAVVLTKVNPCSLIILDVEYQIYYALNQRPEILISGFLLIFSRRIGICTLPCHRSPPGRQRGSQPCGFVRV